MRGVAPIAASLVSGGHHLRLLREVRDSGPPWGGPLFQSLVLSSFVAGLGGTLAVLREVAATAALLLTLTLLAVLAVLPLLALLALLAT